MKGSLRDQRPAMSCHQLDVAFIADAQYAAVPSAAVVFCFPRLFAAAPLRMGVMLKVLAFAAFEYHHSLVGFLFPLFIQLRLPGDSTLYVHKNIIRTLSMKHKAGCCSMAATPSCNKISLYREQMNISQTQDALKGRRPFRQKSLPLSLRRGAGVR